MLDIGTGCGLLAMMAASAGADEVYACEVNIKKKLSEGIDANFMCAYLNLLLLRLLCTSIQRKNTALKKELNFKIKFKLISYRSFC